MARAEDKKADAMLTLCSMISEAIYHFTINHCVAFVIEHLGNSEIEDWFQRTTNIENGIWGIKSLDR